MRWWDGTQWTNDTQPAQFPSGAPAAGPSYGRVAPSASFAERNQRSLTAIGVTALYALIAVTMHFVLFGIIPAMAAARAVQRKEQLAPLAVVAAAVAIGIAFMGLAGG